MSNLEIPHKLPWNLYHNWDLELFDVSQIWAERWENDASQESLPECYLTSIGCVTALYLGPPGLFLFSSRR